MSKSLRKDVIQFARLTFPEVYPPIRFALLRKFISFINSPNGGLWVVLLTIILFTIGQVSNPPILQWLHIPESTSRIIIDQRAANLAAIFSITLVVIGWLLTNLSIRESLPFQLLFERTFLYPIFYFVGTLIACLVTFSLLRHEKFINLGNVVIAGTALIIIALILITFLFVRFIKVIGAAFIYDALGEKVIQEMNILAKIEISTRLSRTLFKEKCESLTLKDGIHFNSDLSGHIGINITPLNYKEKPLQDQGTDIFASLMMFEIWDVNLDRLEKQIGALNISSICYYRPVHIGSNITENYCPFFISIETNLPKKFSVHIKRAFRLKPPREKKILENRHLNYFNERFIQDVRDGKKDNIQKGLSIYTRIFDLEDKIYSKC